MAARDLDVAKLLSASNFTSSAYFIFGSDAEFVDSAVSESIDRIQKSRSDLSRIERFSADAVLATPSIAIDFFNERALFGEHRFIAITGVTEKHAPILRDIFCKDTPPPGPLMLISSNSLTTKSKLLASARESSFCTIVRAYEAQLTRQEISAQLSDLGVNTVEPEALAALHQRLIASNFSARTQTLKLASLYANNATLTRADLETVLPPTEDQLAGELLQSIFAGDAKALLAWRRTGAAEGAEPVAQLAIAARAISEARRARSASAGPPVFWRTEKTVKDAAKRFADLDQRLEYALVAAHQLERAARSSEALIAEKTERFLIRLATLFS